MESKYISDFLKLMSIKDICIYLSVKGLYDMEHSWHNCKYKWNCFRGKYNFVMCVLVLMSCGSVQFQIQH